MISVASEPLDAFMRVS